jgi:LytS/YehU family sensor histidine kinase
MEFKQAIYWIMIIYPVHLGWSILYFGIKIWIDWDNERVSAEKTTILAQRAQLQLLRYQVNPHFLFNSLNSIRALVDEDRNNAKKMITELSEFLRYSLISRNQYEIKLKDELDAIRHYISIEKKRYEEKLDIRFEVDPNTEDLPIMGFLIHPLVENAIKYGMQTSTMPLRIIIKTSVENQRLKINVANSGSWVKESSKKYSTGTGTGLENVKARLENTFGRNYTMKIIDERDKVSVALEVPISRNNIEMNS